jgi:Cu(I)/Ag(I) efflux system membrane protein CusA/SilA
MQDFRSDLSELERVLVPVSGERQIPIGDLARISMVEGPAMLRDIDGMLTGYVYIDVGDGDPNAFVAQASRVLAQTVATQPGYSINWVGQYQAAQEAHRRLVVIIPAVLLIIALLLYTSTRSAWRVALIALAVPFSAIGAVWLLWILGYKMSIAVWVGIIALLGLDAETGVFMLMYLDLTYKQALKAGRLRSVFERRTAIVHGAAQRIRPKLMTVVAAMIGLLPILWSEGAGSDVLKRIAAPMIGGLATSFLLELLLYPALYELAQPVLQRSAALQENTAA